MEIWLNGLFLGRGSVTSIVETGVDEATATERSQRAEIVVKQSERSGMDLKGQWFIKKYVDGEDTKRQIVWAVVATIIATVLIVSFTVGTIHGHNHPPAIRCLDGTVLYEAVVGGWGCVPK